MANFHEKKIIILLGPPGVGKGSQAVRICKKFLLPHISTGDILRENIKNKTDLGQKAEEIIAQGDLVPDDLINAMLSERVKSGDCANGFLLDGYPRTLNQAQYLESHMQNSTKLKVINLAASDQTILDRISGRLTCKGCSAVYHKKFNPPQVDSICDICGAKLVQRNDDRESVVQERLKIYNKETKPLIDFYKDKNLLHTISCEKAIDQVFQQASNIILEKNQGGL